MGVFIDENVTWETHVNAISTKTSKCIGILKNLKTNYKYLKTIHEYLKTIYTMFPLYPIAIPPFQFSYRIGLLFPLERMFFGMIFIMEKGWNPPILKVIRTYQVATDLLQKPNGNKFGTIIGYDFEFKWKSKFYKVLMFF